MLTAGTVIYAFVSYLLMLGAFYLHRLRKFHVTIMVAIIASDFCFPFYLYLTRDWIRRLIKEEEIFSFLVWMHLILIITLYALYIFQIQAGRRIMGGDEEGRIDHRGQAKGILITRALVIFTGAMLVQPEDGPKN